MIEDPQVLMSDLFPYILELTYHYQHYKCQLRPQQMPSLIFGKHHSFLPSETTVDGS